MPHAPGRRNEGRKRYECGEKNKVGRKEERERGQKGERAVHREEGRERGRRGERIVRREEGGRR